MTRYITTRFNFKDYHFHIGPIVRDMLAALEEAVEKAVLWDSSWIGETCFSEYFGTGIKLGLRCI